MNLLLITTSDIESGRFDVLERMVRSVAQTAAARPDLCVTVLLLLQKCPEYRYWTLSKTLPRFVQAIPSTGVFSLSAARNTLLARAVSSALVDGDTIVGFPDDDCWYPEGSLDYVVQLFSREPQLDLWFCRYASNPISVAGFESAVRQAEPRDVIRNASSNTMFVRGRVLTADLTFDETLGVGTANGGGEDTEFALRAHLSGRRSLYLPAPIIGHRDKTRQLRPRYYRGGLIAIARHARHEPRVGFELLRKLAVGLWLVVTRQLPIGAFTRAIIAAVRSSRPAAAQA